MSANWRPTSPRNPRRRRKRLPAKRRRLPPLYLMDTTGLAYRREDRLLRFRRGKEVRRVRGHTRLLALMRWDRRRRLLWPWGGVAGEGYAPDPRLGGEV
ncbi:MAG: IS5/IS1182 family transposase, partial [Thermus sp.]